MKFSEKFIDMAVFAVYIRRRSLAAFRTCLLVSQKTLLSREANFLGGVMVKLYCNDATYEELKLSRYRHNKISEKMEQNYWKMEMLC